MQELPAKRQQLAEEAAFHTKVEDPLDTRKREKPLSLQFSRDAASTLLPTILEDDTYEQRVGHDQSDTFFDMTIVDRSRLFDEGVAKKKFVFDESTRMSDFYEDGEEVHMPVLYLQLGRLNRRPEVMVLNTMDISTELQGNGIGSDLHQRIITLAGNLGFERIVGVAVDEIALSFDIKNGYTVLEDEELIEIMERQGLLGEGEDGVPVVYELEE